MEVDGDELYKAAELAYKIYHGDAGVSLNLDPDRIRSKLHQLNRGLPVESEFAALALWSGRCKYIHKLDRDTLPKDCTYEIPDFLCFIDVDGRAVPLLVEVKTSSNQVRSFGKKYCSALQAFADKLGLPILIDNTIDSLKLIGEFSWTFTHRSVEASPWIPMDFME